MVYVASYSVGIGTSFFTEARPGLEAKLNNEWSLTSTPQFALMDFIEGALPLSFRDRSLFTVLCCAVNVV